MAPVQRTYGGYNPKRKGLPKYILKGSEETTGIFPALHIDNLKVIRAAVPTKASYDKRKILVKGDKPTFDVTLDSTFDKIVKNTNLEGMNKVTPGKCLTCGCVPPDLGRHALFECKEDPFYLTPQSNGAKKFKKKQTRSIAVRERKLRKGRLALTSSPVASSPSKPSTFSPIFKLDEEKCESQLGVTSTPTFKCQRLTFDVKASPIHIADGQKHCDVSRNRLLAKSVLKCGDEEWLVVGTEVTSTPCLSGSKEDCIESDNATGSVVESSVVMVDPLKATPSSGYITKRRRWRRNRYVMPCNISADMFSSVDKTHDLDAISETSNNDRLQASALGNETSTAGRKLDKSDSNDVVGRHMTYSHHESVAVSVKRLDSENVSTAHLDELSQLICKSLNLQADKVGGESVEESGRKSADPFSGLSFRSQKEYVPCLESNRKNLSHTSHVLEENSIHVDCTEQMQPLLEGSQVLPLGSSTLYNSRGDSVICRNSYLEMDKEIILKPCYVRLYKCDIGTVADVMFTSQNDACKNWCDNEDSAAHPNNVSDESLNSCSKRAVLTVPLAKLGDVNQVSLHNNRLTLESSFLPSGTCEQASVVSVGIDKDGESSHQQSVGNGGILPNENEDIYTDVLSRCGQTEPLPFESCYPKSMQPNCNKIGEGAYGEVFLHNTSKRSTVIKIIPVEGDDLVNGAVQKKLWEIRPEIVVAQELSTLRKSATPMNRTDVFNEVFAVRCVRGRYPKWMLNLWNKYDKEEGSENDCPDMFGADQLYIVLELANGGRDLESYTFSSADEAVAALAQIVFALAVGESAIQFEHRDLHWGNILVAPCEANDVSFTLEGTKYKVPSKGVKVSVIDFTMSRMTMPNTGENLFYDFGGDEDLFAAQGDYQCDIYRLMRERTKNNWAVFEPLTNILWLHYVVDKMCTMVAYRSRSSKLHQEGMRTLKKLRNAVLAYPSALAFARSDFFKALME